MQIRTGGLFLCGNLGMMKISWEMLDCLFTTDLRVMSHMKKELHSALKHDYYVFHKTLYPFVGGAIRVLARNGDLLLRVAKRVVADGRDVLIYLDKPEIENLLVIRMRGTLGLSPTSTVQDATTGETIGTIQRRILKTLLKRKWFFFAPDGTRAAELSERTTWILHNYDATSPDGIIVAQIRQHFGLFADKYSMTVPQPEPDIDRRLLIAAGVLLIHSRGGSDLGEF